ncbi:ShlB/FhaC/HecB family hemolysin secretion/activation protein [Rhodoplanes roseus]|uniref:ShlB/FhaC/HecB family hemolysin secretion/activation protein n=1 Tax=Rhodoplanes roseus TaxID=29409 RepID=UPI000DADAA4D|nr:ShlB/FhaC/HecB family hemolysin secretion/activation protein [Rhodoplanes roseus]
MACALRGLAPAVLAALLAGASPAAAQYVERNLPPAPPRGAPAIDFITPDLLKGEDDTPLGRSLSGIVLLGAKDQPLAAPRRAGVDVERIPAIAPDVLRQRLSAFLGRPISRKLIAEVQAAISAVYKDAGRAFVSVTIPPQEITGGALQVRVIEYKTGRVTVTGAERAGADHVRTRVRVTPGTPIDSRRLETDLDWLNRNPFRRVEAVFGPGKDLAEADLSLRTSEQARPWQVYTGYANTGTMLTGRDRWFVGGSASLPGEVLASYQATGSRDYWIENGHPINDPDLAQYQSHAGRVIVPLWARASLELIGNYIQTNEQPNLFLRYRTRTTEFSALHRSALENVLPWAFGDLLLGVETKRQARELFFVDVPVAEFSADLFQMVGGWAGRFRDPFGVNDLDVRLKVNPGSMLPDNTSQAWNLFTNGRVADIHYAYATVAYVHTAPLPKGFILTNELFGLISGDPLPDPERISLGGAFTVRGYMTEDRTVDQAVISRNTLYLPGYSIGEALKLPWLQDKFVPYVFSDIGWGREIFFGKETTLASVGAGFDDQIGPFRANLAAGYALLDGPQTPAGSWRIHARVTATY